MGKYFYELFQPKLPRLGPGTKKATLDSFNKMQLVNKNLNILDVGCGNGAQTLDLAEIIDGHITAVDFNQQFVDELILRAEQKGLSNKISAKQGDMNNLVFADNEFDVIWCEGAIYIAGIENALKAWKSFLKPNGYMAVTDLCWLTEKRPAEIHEYMTSRIPWTATVDEYLTIIKNQGYIPIDNFPLPVEAWIDNYYNPLLNELEIYDKKFAGIDEAMEVSKMMRTEKDMFDKYSQYYGYVFYIIRKA